MSDLPFILQLKDTLELAYRDGMTRILDWQTDFDRVKGHFLDGNELFGFEITPDSIRYEPIPAIHTDTRLDDACRIGRACGEGCVSKEKGCQIDGAIVRRAARSTIANAKTDLILKEHQLRIAEKLRNQRGLIVYHGLGSGKTLTAINAAEEYGGAAVIVPASLRDNFKKELVKAKAKGDYGIYSYDEFRAHPPDLKGKMLIVDEAHRLRNSSTQTTQAISDSAKSADKVLLLTGTPLQNKPHELAPLINIVSGANTLPEGETAFNSQYINKKKIVPSWTDRLFKQAPIHTIVEPKNLKEFKQQTSQYVDYYQPTQEGYPTVNKQTVEVEMDKGQIATYRSWSDKIDPVTRRKMRDNLPLDKQEAGELNAFINAQRQIANTPQGFDRNSHALSPKLKEISDHIETSPGPALVYSNYLYSGTEPLAKELTRRGIKHATFTGDMNDQKKKAAVDAYNSGGIKALIVSSSGGEGLDLKNTAQVHIMEPHWHDEKIQQVTGRAIRYQSHASLPEDKRHVEVYQYLSVLPQPWMPGAKREPTADQYLNEMSQKKKALNQKFLEGFQTHQDTRTDADTPITVQIKNALELVYRDGITRILDWQQDGQEMRGRFLDGNELFSFTIAPDGINYTPEPIPRNDAYLMGFFAQAQGVNPLLVLDSQEYWSGYLSRGQRRADKQSQCKIGRSCGEGCVSRDKSCTVDTPIVKQAARSLLSRGNSQEFQLKPSDLDRKIRLKEDEIRLLDHEKAIGYDAQGNVLLEKTGSSGGVAFSAAEMQTLKGATVTHNHPAAMYFGNGSEVDGGSFSVEDWNFAARTELKEIRAVGAEARYSLTPPKEGWSQDWWQTKGARTYQKNFQQVHGELVAEIQSGRITPERANIEVWHRTSDRAAKELGMTYKREPITVTERDRAAILKNLPTARKRIRKEKTQKAAIGALIGLSLGIGAAVGVDAWRKNRREFLSQKTDLPEPNDSELERTLRREEEKIRFQRYETGIYMDADGKTVAREDGNEGSVEFSFNDREMQSLKGTTFTHNHPGGGTFSNADIHMAATVQVKELRAVSETERFALHPPAEGWNEEWWEKKGKPTLKRCEQQAYRDITKQMALGNVNIAEAHFVLWDRSMRLAAKELGMKYTREPLSRTPQPQPEPPTAKAEPKSESPKPETSTPLHMDEWRQQVENASVENLIHINRIHPKQVFVSSSPLGSKGLHWRESLPDSTPDAPTPPFPKALNTALSNFDPYTRNAVAVRENGQIYVALSGINADPTRKQQLGRNISDVTCMVFDESKERQARLVLSQFLKKEVSDEQLAAATKFKGYNDFEVDYHHLTGLFKGTVNYGKPAIEQNLIHEMDRSDLRKKTTATGENTISDALQDVHRTLGKELSTFDLPKRDGLLIATATPSDRRRAEFEAGWRVFLPTKS